METQKPTVTCSVCDCDRAVHLKGMCVMHYARMKRHGSTDDPKPEKWGQKRDHPLWVRWRKLLNRGVLCNEWEDFWKFVEDVGLPPENCKILKRLNEEEPYRINNCEWAKTPTAEDKSQYLKQYRKDNLRNLQNARFIRQYGISLEDYEKLFAEQNGLCAICKEPERAKHRTNETRIRMMCIDHCHITGKVRGLLCGDCNRGLGMFRDNPKYLSSASDYLIKHAP
jgi:hypothetical protein